MVLAFPQEGDLVASWVALLSFTPQWGTQPQAPQPQTDSAAGAGPTLDISFTGQIFFITQRRSRWQSPAANLSPAGVLLTPKPAPWEWQVKGGGD